MATKKRRKRKTKKNKNNATKYIVILIILTILVLFTTKKILSIEKYANYYQINENTSKYISYQYKENNIVELKTKILTNEKGISKANSYSYTVKNSSDNDLNYQVLLTPIDINDTNDIIIYLTDKNNNVLTDIISYNDLPNIGNSKVLYTSSLAKKEVSKQILRIWSNKNTKKISFKLNTKIK